MRGAVSAFLSGFVFGLGLIISEMVNPMRVRGFLDIAHDWDPTLLFVMLGALVVTFIGYRVVFLRSKPFFAEIFSTPTRTEIDRRLILGAAIFGIGWALGGICPGPAIVGLATLNLDLILFFVAMLVGMKLFDIFDNHRIMN